MTKQAWSPPPGFSLARASDLLTAKAHVTPTGSGYTLCWLNGTTSWGSSSVCVSRVCLRCYKRVEGVPPDEPPVTA